MDDDEISAIQKALEGFFNINIYDQPTLCTDRSRESLDARDLLQECGIPFHFWNAKTHPSDWRPPFMTYGMRIAIGLQEIEDLVIDYPGILKVHRSIYKTPSISNL